MGGWQEFHEADTNGTKILAGNTAQLDNYETSVLIAEREWIGAGDGNRTHLAGLGSRCITTMLHPHFSRTRDRVRT